MNKKYSKDCFDRFGDDLCELLLTYLSIGDCFRVECVSGQWRRLAFNGQKKLVINRFVYDKYRDVIKQLMTHNFALFDKWGHLNRCSIRKASLESLLHKCPLIAAIVIEYEVDVDEQVIDIIADKCRHLSSLTVFENMSSISSDCLTRFGQKCGHRLQSLSLVGVSETAMKALLRLTPNIKSINCGNCEINTFLEPNESLFLSRVKEIQTIAVRNDFHLFAAHYCSKLTKLSVDINRRAYKTKFKDMSNKYINLMDAFIELSRFVKLVKLDICLSYYEKSEETCINDGLKLIGENCSQLTELAIESGSLMSLDDDPNSTFALRVKCFKGFARLRHLKLELLDLNEADLSGVHLYLPNLTAIQVRSKHIITDQILFTLAKLPKLMSVRLLEFDYPFVITDSGVCNLIDNCLLIRNIDFLCTTTITKASLNLLSERAKGNPKVKYKFLFRSSKIKDKDLYNLPNNLYVDRNIDIY